MQMPPLPRLRYSRAARWFHWLVFAAVALAYLLINIIDLFPRGSDAKRLVLQGHFMAGLVVLVLVLPRLLHRFRNAPPAITPALVPWQSTLSRPTHFLLYAFLLVQPVLGVWTVWARGRGIGVPFTGLEISSPLSADRAFSQQLGDIHGWIGTIFYYVIGLHVLSAAWHHFVRRDDTLRRMT